MTIIVFVIISSDITTANGFVALDLSFPPTYPPAHPFVPCPGLFMNGLFPWIEANESDYEVAVMVLLNGDWFVKEADDIPISISWCIDGAPAWKPEWY